jgi:effector-binding domain-containing protein
MASKKKSQDPQEAAIQWLISEGKRAMERKDKKVIDILGFIINRLREPDYKQYLEEIRKRVAKNGTLSISEYIDIVPKDTTRTINHN